MKNSVNSNMYEVTLNSVWSLFEEYLSGEQQALIVIVSSVPLGEQAHKALQSSFDRLGYGQAACTFVVQKPTIESAELSDKEFFILLEGLDPKILVITDDSSAHLCGKSYGLNLVLDTRMRLFGRDVCVFSSFENMIADNASKQKAWALIKSLPKLSLP